MGNGPFSDLESSAYSSFLSLLGLDVGNRRRHPRCPNPGRIQDFLRPYQTDGTAGRVSELNQKANIYGIQFNNSIQARLLSQAPALTNLVKTSAVMKAVSSHFFLQECKLDFGGLFT